jgi:DNA-binding NarL/FixJ family response regulator
LPKDELLLLIIDAGDNPVASIEQIKLFKERYPTGRIAVLADRCQSNEVMCAYRAGANAYLVKVSACNVLIKSLELVMLGETIVSPAILSSMSRRAPPGPPLLVAWNGKKVHHLESLSHRGCQVLNQSART